MRTQTRRLQQHDPIAIYDGDRLLAVITPRTAGGVKVDVRTPNRITVRVGRRVVGDAEDASVPHAELEGGAA